MANPIIVEYIGDTPNIRVLCFFLEHPFHLHSLNDIIKCLDLPKRTTKKWIEFYVDREFIKPQGGKYKTNIASPMFDCVKAFTECLGFNVTVEHGVFPVESAPKPPKMKKKAKKEKKEEMMCCQTN